MDHTRSGKDGSSCKEPSAKRSRGCPQIKSVMVLLDSDVTVTGNGEVLMPNNIEKGWLKKKGQYGKITFSPEMTVQDVRSALHSKFPSLRNKRLYCAAAVKDRTMLDFHGERQLWNGTLIRRHIKGNSALYLLAEGSCASEEPQVLPVGKMPTCHQHRTRQMGSVLAATQILQELSQISSTTDQGHLTGKRDALHAFVSSANREWEPELLQRGKEDLTTQADHTILQQGLSVVQERQNNPVAQTTLDPDAQESPKAVSMTSCSKQRELITQTSEQGSYLGQAPPAAAAEAAAHKSVPVELLLAVSEGETSDSAVDSMLENESNHDTVQSRDIVHEISPCKGSTKGGDKFHILLRDIVPLEIDSFVACFQNCGTVHLKQTVNIFTLTGSTPESLQGPGEVNVTLMSSDGSWWGGEAVFEYIDDPLTNEEYLNKVVTNNDMRLELFKRMHKKMSSNKPSEGQTSDSSGKTGPGSSRLNQSRSAQSVELLQLLVYKAAEIDGQEFIQMIFSTSAGKVVFNSYRNSATLPEDVARVNGHSALANYLQDVNIRLSEESNSDAGTEFIDWLELKHAVDKEQSLTSGTDDAQILKKCQSPSYPESDDDESDYFADDEISPWSSPSHNNVFDSENEDHNQNSKMTESSCEKEVNEENNLPVENSDSAKFPLHLVRNQLEVTPSMKAENSGYEHKQLDSENVESHSSGDDITEKEYESKVPCRDEVENWDTFGSEVVSSTATTSARFATHNVERESGLDGDQKDLRMTNNDEISRSRGLPFNPQEQSTEGIEVNASTCHIDAGQVKNWHSILEDKPGLLKFSRDISNISRRVVEKLGYCRVELEKGHSATGAAAVAEEEHFKEEEGGLAEEMSFGNCDRKVDLESTANKNDVNKQQDSSLSTIVSMVHDAPAQGNPGKSDTALRVTLLASGWRGCSTIHRQLVTQIAQLMQVQGTLLVPQFACTEEEKKIARSHNISIREAERRPGYDPLEWLSFPPRDLVIDIVVGCEVKLGKQAQVVRESHRCKWVQVVHSAPEDLRLYKTCAMTISKVEDLRELPDLVVPVGPKLTEAYSRLLRSSRKPQNIFQLTPGILGEFSDVTQAATDAYTFKVLTFGRGDLEDFWLKGNDIAAKAIVELKDSSYRLIFVGAAKGEQVAENLVQCGISRGQQTVRACFTKRLKQLFCEVDLAIMPSRTEEFGLVALGALSAGVPILVSGNSGFGYALRSLPSGKSVVVDSEDPKDWAKAIAGIRQKDRPVRLQEIQRLRSCYEEKFSWGKQCKALVEKMRGIVHVIESSCEKEVNEENNLPVENSDSSRFPLHLVRNQLEVTPSMKAENSGYEHKQLDSENVESHSSGDDITEKEYESKVPCPDEVENWYTFGSEVVSIIKKASTATTSARFATHNVDVTYLKESGLDGDQKDLRMTDNDEISRSRAHAPCQVSSGDDINYKAKSGYVLVINNHIFPRRIDTERTGSNDDVRNLISLFDDFNFRHKVVDNQTGSQMLELLSGTAEKDFSKYDCFVCVILSHGKKDAIYGTDEDVIKIEALTSLFRRNECPSLEGKPKIFLIQACRGSQRDRVPVESDSDPVPLSSSSLPADADFLICFASAPGHQSYRQPLLGSWFISSVVNVFKEYAEREHLMDMMLRVNNRVAEFFSKEGLKQMPCQVCMLRKKVFFDPKYNRT